MELRLISSKEVSQLLPMSECIELMEQTLSNMARGLCDVTQRQGMWLPEKQGVLGTMPAFDSGIGRFGAKLMSVFPGNHAKGLESHQGIVMLFDENGGKPLAIINANEITAIRTAAVSAVATRHLSNQDSNHLLILGCGVQAYKHIEAILQVRKIDKISVWDLHSTAAEKLAQKVSSKFQINVDIQTGKAAQTNGADIICTLSPAKEPILFGKDLEPGVHVNAVGSCNPMSREIDTPLVLKSKIYVDKKEATFNEAGDILIPMKEGIIDKNHVLGELGEVCIHKIPGRTSSEEITLFEALGIAVEDLAAASYIYDQAIQKEMGVTVNL